MRMMNTKTVLTVLMISLMSVPAFAEDEAPTVAEQMAGLESMCEASAEAAAARHAETPLYERLGGYDRIHELTTEIVRLHGINPDIERTMVHVDPANLARLVADFVAAGTGGTTEYAGRDLPSSHEHLKLTDADFLSAGGDVIQAMKNLGHGENEINEIVCILVSLKDQVVFE